MRERILDLRRRGMTYRQIAEELGCSRGLISYHCGDGQKEKTKRSVAKQRQEQPLLLKINAFKYPKSRVRDFQRRNGSHSNSRVDTQFGFRDVIRKFGDSPVCYLTGRPINWADHNSFNLDHIVAATRGGTNTIDNLGVTCPQANFAKGDLTVEEFVQLCKEVVMHFGYKVTK